MADNYLEKKFEQLNSGKTKVVRKNYPSLDTLLHKTRSYRGYDKSHVVSVEELEKIVSVNTLIASARNQQVLRFRLITKTTGAELLIPQIHLGAALPEEHLPKVGTEPEAFIVVCATKEEDRYVDMDLGISLQSMALRATELGLSTCIICAFNREKVQQILGLEFTPLAILAVGKGAGSIFLKPVSEGEDLNYYRKDGVHYVPKLKTEDLILK